MIVRIEIEIPDVKPNTPEAVDAVDGVEKDVEIALRAYRWWIDVENGETRYMPENVSELS